MSVWRKLFDKQQGGSILGKAWRSWIDRHTFGITHLLDNLKNRDED